MKSRAFPQDGSVLSADALNAAQEQHFQVFADSISNLAWIADADGWIYWYNFRWYEYTGATPEQMEGWGWQSVHDPALLPDVMQRWQASIASGVPFEMTFPLRARNGEFHPFLTRIVPLKDESGKVLRWFGTNTDISQQVEAARALRESEQRFRLATEAVDGILWTNDSAGEMHGAQPGWSEFTGQTEQQYRGYGWSLAIHPEDAQPTIDAWQLAVRERRRFVFEHRVRRQDGVYRLCSVRALPSFDDSGNISEWIGIHTDITEDRRTRQQLQATVAALKQQQELIQAAELVAEVGFWRLHPSDANPFLSIGTRNLLGLPATGDITAQEAYAQVHPDDLPGVLEATQDAVTSGRYQVEFRVVPAPGEETRSILGVARVLTTDHGEPYFVGMNLDITRSKLASEALLRAEKLAVAGRLAASIAHEINNPLEAVVNLLFLLQQTTLSDEQHGYAETMQSELGRIAHIATHTLRFHRQSTRSSQASPARLIESVLALHEGRIRNAGVRVVERYRATCTVFGFESEIRQVIANLVGNAIDAMNAAPEPRLLFLRTRNATLPQTGEPGLTFTFADTGLGMSPETLGRIFDAFFTTKSETGTGLGLWVSKEIVDKHRGTLRVRTTEREGRCGTVFQLFLPSAGNDSVR